MKSPKFIFAIGSALAFSAGLLAQTTGTTSGGTTTGSTSTGTPSTVTGGTTSGGTTTGSTSTGTTSTVTGGTTSGGMTTGSTTTVTTTTGGTTSGGTSTGATTTVTTTTMRGNGKAVGNGKSDTKPSPHTPNPNASPVSQAVQTALQKFDANRDQYMTDRKALLEKLEAAKTEAERKAILDELKQDQMAQKSERTQLGKEIRDELRKLREQRKGGG